MCRAPLQLSGTADDSVHGSIGDSAYDTVADVYGSDALLLSLRDALARHANGAATQSDLWAFLQRETGGYTIRDHPKEQW